MTKSKQNGSPIPECTTSCKQTIIYTTFLETERHSFKDLVQKLTGVSDEEKLKLPLTMPSRKPSRGSSVAGPKSDCALNRTGIEVGHKISDSNGFALIKSGVEMGSKKSDSIGFALNRNGIEMGSQKSDCNGFALSRNGIEMGPQKSDCNGFALIKSGIEVGSKKSDCNGFALNRAGIEMGPQKTGFKIQKRRQFEKRLEMKLGVGEDLCGGGNGCVLSGSVNPSPNSHLGPVDPFACSSSSYCYNNYSPSCCSTLSCSQSSCLEEQDEEFWLEGSAITVKREPQLLPLFPLHSPTKPRT